METPPSSSAYVTEPLLISKKAVRARPLFDPPIVKRAIGDSFVKLHPRLMMKNPVMFVVEVGAAMTTLEIFKELAMGHNIGFTFQISLWLWFTVLFANFAEAMAEGRGKAQADTLRKTKTETMAKRLKNGKKYETVAATE
jgi:K+-transporting ATPase ATPase B chain